MRLGCTFERKRPFVHSFQTEGGHATIFEGDSNFWILQYQLYFISDQQQMEQQETPDLNEARIDSE